MNLVYLQNCVIITTIRTFSSLEQPPCPVAVTSYFPFPHILETTHVLSNFMHSEEFIFWTFMYKCLCRYMFSNLLGIYLRVAFLIPLVMLTFWETESHFLNYLHHSTFLPATYECSIYCTSAPTYYWPYLLLWPSQWVGNDVSKLCSLFLCFMLMMLDIFPWLISHLYIILGEHLFRFFPIFNWIICILLLNSRMSLYILDKFPLSNTWLANILSHFWLVCSLT